MYQLGLIGYPLEHSFSAILHQAALRDLGLEGEYQLYPIEPLPGGKEELIELLKCVKNESLHGLNVTIPHKQAVIPYLEKLTAETRAIGAVNTIIPRGGKLTGANTDAPGFIQDLQAEAYSHLMVDRTSSQLQKSSALAVILGAGGAARAAAYGLGSSGWELIIAARRFEQAQGLAESLSQVIKTNRITSFQLGGSQFNKAAAQADLIVNATSVGMYPNVDYSPWPERIPLPKNSFVYDMVYNPKETLLLKQAVRQEIPHAGGIGMLVEQAAIAFELWTGFVASRDAMRRALKEL